MALARLQRQSKASHVLAPDPLWPPRGAGPWPKAALPALAVRGRSGPGQGAGGGDAWRGSRPKDLYELLGVQSSATQAQIKTAYYKQSFLCHPDRNPGSVDASERFIHITQAYQVLGSLSLRKKYDRGLLTQKDISNAKKPSGKSKAAAPAEPKKTQTYTFGHPLGKPIFNFDAFYRAHYGEQLERDRLARQKQQELQKRQEAMKQEKYKVLEHCILLLFLSSVIILIRS